MAANHKDVAFRVQQGYDQMADKYLAWTGNRPSPRLRYIDKLLKQLRDEDKQPGLYILELGCGAGVPATQYLASHAQVKKVIASDISPRQIELAREHVTNTTAEVDFVCGDMSTLSFEPALLDGVTAFFSIFHLPRQSQAIVLRNVYKWLKPGGCLVCNFGSPSGEVSRKQEAGCEKDGFAEFLGVEMYADSADIDGSLRMVREAGFESLQHEVLDATDGKETLYANDPDHEVKFLWIVATKGR